MSYLVDGSNVLGSARESDGDKRELVRRLAQFARSRSTSVICYFDGAPPDGFAISLGRVTVEFTHPKSADQRIAERVAGRGGATLHVVTSDRALADRVRSRRVQVLSREEFLQGLEPAPQERQSIDGEDWEGYFSDPKNRNVF